MPSRFEERAVCGNVISILVPLSTFDDQLICGLDLLEESLGDASAA
jgi:4-aminobutyrate aminotransferase-like enzyme